MEPTDVKGPLVQFQAAKFSKEEMKRVMKAINSELEDAALTSNVLDDVFEMWWPKLEEQILAALKTSDEGSGQSRRSERDLLEEVLSLTRRQATGRGRSMSPTHPAWQDLLINTTRLAKLALSKPPDPEIITAVHRCIKPVAYLYEHVYERDPVGLRSRHSVDDIQGIFDIQEMLASIAPDADGVGEPPSEK